MQNEIKVAKTAINSGMDKVIIPVFHNGILGGRTLDVSCYEPEIIKAGCPVVTDGEGNYAPVNVSDEKYAFELKEGQKIAGVVVATTLKSNPAVSIMFHGVVNSAAAPYYDEATIEAIKKDCPDIMFTKDEEA